jgi:transglutaminase-like putative cysteine protease
MFGSINDRAEQVRAVCAWVKEHIAYKPGATDAKTSAWDVWQSREGVCRDYVHLAIAFCRALTIPTRYVGGYAIGLDPMDFHACFEVYLGGAWHLFDPTEDVPPEHTVVVSRGRDAAQAGLTIIYGRVQAGPVEVTCTLASPES